MKERRRVVGLPPERRRRAPHRVLFAFLVASVADAGLWSNRMGDWLLGEGLPFAFALPSSPGVRLLAWKARFQRVDHCDEDVRYQAIVTSLHGGAGVQGRKAGVGTRTPRGRQPPCEQRRLPSPPRRVQPRSDLPARGRPRRDSPRESGERRDDLGGRSRKRRGGRRLAHRLDELLRRLPKRRGREGGAKLGYWSAELDGVCLGPTDRRTLAAQGPDEAGDCSSSAEFDYDDADPTV